MAQASEPHRLPESPAAQVGDSLCRLGAPSLPTLALSFSDTPEKARRTCFGGPGPAQLRFSGSRAEAGHLALEGSLVLWALPGQRPEGGGGLSSHPTPLTCQLGGIPGEQTDSLKLSCPVNFKVGATPRTGFTGHVSFDPKPGSCKRQGPQLSSERPQ